MSDEESDYRRSEEEMVRKSLEEHGFKAPVVVEREGDTLTILQGLKRFKAAEASDEISTIPVVVYDE